MVEHALETGRSQSEILASHSSKELTEKMIYTQMYPMGVKRADLQAGIIASTIANVNRGKGQKPFKVDDFIPKFDDPKSEWQTDEQLLTNAKAMAEIFGGKMKKVGEG